VFSFILLRALARPDELDVEVRLYQRNLIIENAPSSVGMCDMMSSRIPVAKDSGLLSF
jgi:hypothetical protein